MQAQTRWKDHPVQPWLLCQPFCPLLEVHAITRAFLLLLPCWRCLSATNLQDIPYDSAYPPCRPAECLNGMRRFSRKFGRIDTAFSVMRESPSSCTRQGLALVNFLSPSTATLPTATEGRDPCESSMVRNLVLRSW